MGGVEWGVGCGQCGGGRNHSLTYSAYPAYEESHLHRLASTIDISISDLFLAESVSRRSPLKMFGEWVNEKEHPRDTRHGTLMLKVSDRNEVVICARVHPLSNETSAFCV